MKAFLIIVIFWSWTPFAYSEVKELYLLGPIHEDSLNLLKMDMTALGLEPNEDRLVVHLESPGGDSVTSWNMFAFLRWISSHNIPVTTRVESYCGSACIPVFAAGDFREARPESTFYFHAPEFIGELSEEEIASMHQTTVEKYIEHLRWADEDLANYVEQSGIAAEGETPMTAKEIDHLAPNFLDLI